MRFLFIIYSMAAGGAERVTASLANHWASERDEVIIATLRGEPSFYPLDPAVRLVAIAENQRESGARAMLRRVLALRNLLKRERPDVAIAMTSSWCMELALARMGLPLVAIGSERVHPPTVPLGQAREWLRRWTYGLLDAVVVQTRRSLDWVCSHTNARRVEVIPNPVASLLPQPAARLQAAPDDASVVLGVGRLVPQKRFDLLVAAFARAAVERPAWHLVIVGSGQDGAALARLAAASGVGGRIHFPGRSDAMAGWYARADIYVSASDFEGYPNTLLEAMCSGVACIATDCETGPSELIDQGIDGLLVPIGDATMLASAITTLMDDAELRAGMAQRAARVAMDHAIGPIAERWKKVAFPPSDMRTAT